MRSAIIKLKTKLMNKIAFSVTPKMRHSTEPYKTKLFKLLWYKLVGKFFVFFSSLFW